MQTREPALRYAAQLLAAGAALGSLEGATRALTARGENPGDALLTLAIAAACQALVTLFAGLGLRAASKISISAVSLALALWLSGLTLVQLGIVDLGLLVRIALALLVLVGVAWGSRRPLARLTARVLLVGAPLTVVLCALLTLLPGAASKLASERPSVLLITIDTLRADRLGCYGWELARTETLDRIASEGVLFLDAQAPSAITCPSHVSILTGTDPFEHGAVSNLGTPIRPAAATVADLLADTHDTGAFISGLPLRDEISGLASRFDHYDQRFPPLAWLPDSAREVGLVQILLHLLPRDLGRTNTEERIASETVDSALAWLAERDGPYFCWVHLYDPHIPYAPPPPYDKVSGGGTGRVDGRWYDLSRTEQQKILGSPRDLERMLALYDGEVAYVDDQIERLLAGLPGDAPLLVVTSDHGETHGEHGSWFSRDLHQACLHVPLLVHFPDGRHRGLRVEQQVRLIDIAPTLLDYLGVEAEPTSGISLRELLEDASSPAERPAYALAVFPPSSQREESAFSLRHLGFKLIWRSSRVAAGALVPASELFYDAALDPLETEPLREDQAAGERSALRDQLESWRTQSLPQGEKLEESTTEGLENLGYTGRD